MQIKCSYHKITKVTLTECVCVRFELWESRDAQRRITDTDRNSFWRRLNYEFFKIPYDVKEKSQNSESEYDKYIKGKMC